MNNDDFFNTDELKPEQEIAFFLLLCELKELKDEIELARTQGRGPKEQDKLQEKLVKLEKQVKRDGAKLDGAKVTRSKPKAASTIILECYLAEHPQGSVSISNEGTPSLFRWAADFSQDDKSIDGCEIEEVIRGERIVFSSNTGTELSLSNGTLKKRLSQLRNR